MADRFNKVQVEFISLADRAGLSEGLLVQDLHEGDILEVRTMNHRYMFRILDPFQKKVEVTSDGPHINHPAITTLSGSLLGVGSALRIGWVAIGHSICLEELNNLTLTPTQEISVNGVKVFPIDMEQLQH